MTTSARKPLIASCSFCLKPDTDVAKLVAGPGVFICNECVALSAQIIDGSIVSETPSPPVAPWEMEMSLDAVLTSLRSIGAAGAQTDRNLHLWVAKARGLGGTWTQIGQALGMARQSAWERFSGEE
jgi:ClpX C4-type zinc finger